MEAVVMDKELSEYLYDLGAKLSVRLAKDADEISALRRQLERQPQMWAELEQLRKENRELRERLGEP